MRGEYSIAPKLRAEAEPGLQAAVSQPRSQCGSTALQETLMLVTARWHAGAAAPSPALCPPSGRPSGQSSSPRSWLRATH